MNMFNFDFGENSLLRRRFIKILRGIVGRKNFGYCPICQSKTIFVEYTKWLRDKYQCIKCHSIPRQRALVNTLNLFYSNWKELSVHESSPSNSRFFIKECQNYTFSYFFGNVSLGTYKDGVRCEDLSNMTFDDSSFDLLITQDVFEHVLFPLKAFKEINRILRPGGAHVFTVPFYRNLEKSKARVRWVNGEICFLETPIYHGNPIDKNGSLVTYDWGLDFTDIIFKESNMITTIYIEKDRRKGLDGELLEVFISRKM